MRGKITDRCIAEQRDDSQAIPNVNKLRSGVSSRFTCYAYIIIWRDTLMNTVELAALKERMNELDYPYQVHLTFRNVGSRQSSQQINRSLIMPTLSYLQDRLKTTLSAVTAIMNSNHRHAHSLLIAPDSLDLHAVRYYLQKRFLSSDAVVATDVYDRFDADSDHTAGEISRPLTNWYVLKHLVTQDGSLHYYGKHNLHNDEYMSRAFDGWLHRFCVESSTVFKAYLDDMRRLQSNRRCWRNRELLDGFVDIRHQGYSFERFVEKYITEQVF